MQNNSTSSNSFRARVHNILFESDTRLGKLFDIWLFVFILISSLIVMLDSVPELHRKYGYEFLIVEWVITIFFTIEYILRIYAVKQPLKYMTSPFGIIDLLSIIPTYLSLLFSGTQLLAIVRVLRLLRIFRIFNLKEYLRGGQVIFIALRESRKKIIVFLLFIFLVVTVFGGIMYVVERDHPESGFESIPISIYWAIVTITTVGYGDISPVTALGRFLASVIMIMGYATIAVPTGIVTSEFARIKKDIDYTQHCQSCGYDTHDREAKYCKICGEKL